MIRLCTCKRGSASSLEQSRNRVVIASCKICGGKPLVDGRGSLSGNMLSSVGLELTTVFNPDLTWKTVSKGNRSAARRPRKPIARSVEGSPKLVPGGVEGSNKEDSKRLEDMPISESEKLGVTVLGRRFSDKIEHIPIKKRRFLFRSPSPPPRVSSPHQKDSAWILNSQHALNQENSQNSTLNVGVMAIANAVANELGHVVNADDKVLQEIHEDFSGISILAAAACNNNIEADASNNEEGSADEKFSLGEGSSEVGVKLESRFVEKESCMDDLTNASAAAEEIILQEMSNDYSNNFATMTREVVDEKNVRSSPCRDKDDGSPRKLESAFRDDRLHWDLNVVMDAWENPCEDPIIDTQTNSIHGTTSNSMHNEIIQRGTEDSIERMVQQLDDEPKDVYEPEDSRRSVPGFDESKLDGCKEAEEICSFVGKVISVEIGNATEEDLVKETKLVCNEERFNSGAAEDDADVNHSSFAEAEGITCKTLSRGAESPLYICKQRADDCGAGVIVTSKNSEPQKSDMCLSDSVIFKGASLDDEDVDRESDFRVDGYAPKMKSLDDINSEALLNDGVGISDGSVITLTPPNYEDNGSLQGVKEGLNLGVDEAALGDGDSEKFTHKLSGWTPEVVETQLVVGSLSSDEACRSYGHHENSPGKVALEDPFVDSDYDSDVSHDDIPVRATEKEIEHQTGYDSQYEDGELRESTENNWEEDAGEEVEAEHVDYGSDNKETHGFEAREDAEVGIVDSEGARFKVEGKSKPSIKGLSHSSTTEHVYSNERTGKAVKQQSRGHYGVTVDIEKLKMDAEVDGESTASAGKGIQANDSCVDSSLLASSRMKLSGWDKFPERCQSSADIITEAREGCGGRKTNAGAHVDGMDFKDPATVVVGSTAPGRELPSCSEGPTSSETLLGKDRACIYANRSNNVDDLNSRVEMDTGSAKSVGRGGSSVHMHGRGPGIDNWVDSSRGNWRQNRNNSPSYYGPANFVHPGGKNAAAAAAAKVESNGFIVAPDGTIIKAGIVGPSPSVRVHRQPVNSSSQAGHRSIPRRVSPSDRDEAFGMHMGLGPAGEISPDRSNGVGRNRSGRYGPRVVRTSLRERYSGSLPDDGIDSTMRRQSISPIHRRGTSHLSQPCTRSRSRSRTRSPHVWPSPRGRCSRSPPNFRNDTRMDRIRSPHRRPSFVPDHIVGFAPMPRRHGSPQHTSRWVDDRRNSTDHFREHGYKQRSSTSGRGSPQRIFRRNHRYDLVDSSERMRPDEYYNRHVHPGRFPEVVGTGRRPRYDGSDDDRRKHGDRYGIVHQIRRYDTEDPCRRFQYDIEDGFALRNSRNKDVSDGFHGNRGKNPKEDYVRGIGSRLGDVPRGGVRDDKDHFRYGHDGKYDSNSKSFEVRQCKDDLAPKRRRP